MRRQRDPHDVEGVAIAAFLGVEPRQQLQRLDLGLVAAPDRRERLELVDGVGGASVAERALSAISRSRALRRTPDDPGIGRER